MWNKLYELQSSEIFCQLIWSTNYNWRLETKFNVYIPFCQINAVIFRVNSTSHKLVLLQKKKPESKLKSSINIYIKIIALVQHLHNLLQPDLESRSCQSRKLRSWNLFIKINRNVALELLFDYKPKNAWFMLKQELKKQITQIAYLTR